MATLQAKKLIKWTNKIFRSASNTFWTTNFVYKREQELLPPKLSLRIVKIFQWHSSEYNLNVDFKLCDENKCDDFSGGSALINL